MPAIPQNGTVLVTGVTGFLGSHVADRLLREGYKVIGTARSLQKAEYLQKHFSNLYGDKFKIVQVKDFLEEGVFNDLVKDVDGIAHIAAPFHFAGKDLYEDYYNPSIQGTLNILQSAHKYGTGRVRHVSITSSIAAVMHGHQQQSAGYTYTEADWNDAAGALKDWQPGDKLDLTLAYIAAKTEAELAAYRFVESEKPDFDISTVLPGYMFGPVIHYVEKPEDINVSVSLIWQCYNGLMNVSTMASPEKQPQCFCDVRDVAEIHFKTLISKNDVVVGAVDGLQQRRFLATNCDFRWTDVASVIRKHFPENKKVFEDPEQKLPGCTASSERASELLGVGFGHGFETSVVETVDSLVKLF